MTTGRETTWGADASGPKSVGNPDGTPPRPESPAHLPDALRPEKADVEALRNMRDLKSASPSEGTGVCGG